MKRSFNILATSLVLLWDKVQRGFVLALRSLWLHKLRSFLSVLGIIIGTAAVIALMSFGEGNMQAALDDIIRQGATNIIVRSVKPADSSNPSSSFVANYGLSYRDYDDFKIISSVIRSVPMRIFNKDIRRMSKEQRGRVVGTNEHYQVVYPFEVAMGRFLVDSDNDIGEGDDNNQRNVVVLGSGIATALFPFEKPVGKTIVIGDHYYRVVGVLKNRLPVSGGSAGTAVEDFNNDVYMPLTTCRGRFGATIYDRQSGSFTGEQVELHQVVLTVSEMNKVLSTGEAVRDQLERSHFKKDWDVVIPLDRIKLAEQARFRGLVLLAIIASISLVVGGIGIMNIMLATVTERTREIGIRRALGAKRKDITLQFLIEAIVQTSVGGAVGVLIGLAIVYGVPWIAYTFFGSVFPSKLHVPSIFIAAIFSIVVGVLFGIYPALRASRLDPIEALRHE